MLVDEHGFSMEDAFIFLSVACDAGVAQACKPAPQFGTIGALLDPEDRRLPRPVRGRLNPYAYTHDRVCHLRPGEPGRRPVLSRLRDRALERAGRAG